MTLDELIAQAQALVDALKAHQETAKVVPTEIDVKESDGTEETFVPEAAQ